MNKIKYILLFIICFLTLSVKVNAVGICDGKKITEGNCDIPAITVTAKRANWYVRYTDKYYSDGTGTEMITNLYYGKYNGQDAHLFCLDPNLQNPPTLSKARQLSMASGYDVGILAIYQAYVRGSSVWPEEANVAMRIFNARWGFSVAPEPGKKLSVYKDTKNLINASYTLEGSEENYKYTINKTYNKNAYYLTKYFYCTAVNACNQFGLCGGKFSQTAIDKCHDYTESGFSKDYSGTSYPFTLNVKGYEVSFEGDSSNIEQNISEDETSFTQTIPVNIKGLDDINEALGPKGQLNMIKSQNPSLKIQSIKCNSDKVTCEFEDPSIVGKQLLETDINSFKIKVSGKVADLASVGTLNITVNYNYFFPASISNLAVARYATSNSKYQRMIVFLPYTNFNASTTIKLKSSNVCKSTVEEDAQKYTIGGAEVDEMTYLKNGCCEVEDPYYLTDEGKAYYEENCDSDDIVHLEQKCNTSEEEDKYTHSYVYQKAIKTVINGVQNAESSYINSGSTDGNTLMNTIKEKYGNYTDNDYTYNKFSAYQGTKVEGTPYSNSSDNNYCMLYTSEKNDIFYPGATTAISGRFFVFNKNTQPKVEGKISVTMHTDYDRWLKDYKAAVKAEQDAYDAWQAEENKADAIRNLAKKTSTPTCCKDGEDDEDGNPTCAELGTIDFYSGTATGTYYDALPKNHPKTPDTQSYTDECGGGTVPTADADGKHATYNTAKTYREKLEQFKVECESKNNVSELFDYTLNPDVTFQYEQKYYKDGDVTDIVAPSITMVKSDKAVKYWPNVSVPAKYIDNTASGEKKVVTLDYSYGHDIDVSPDVDQTKNYSASFDETQFYRPDTRYYSLIPTGEYKGETTTSQGTATFVEDGVEVGYVYNIEITNYQGKYGTWFQINNIGHTRDKQIASNVQKSLNKYLQEHPEYGTTLTDYTSENSVDGGETASNMYTNQCEYSSEEVLYERDCVTCDPATNQVMKPQYVYRTISTEDLNPNNRVLGDNWTDPKGLSAREQIESKGAGDPEAYVHSFDEAVATKLANDQKKANVELLNDEVADTSAVNSTYSESSLEYEFDLDTNDMREIKEYNKDHDYSKMSFSQNPSNGEYSFSCHIYTDEEGNKYTDGKECQSSFLTNYAQSDKEKTRLEKTRTAGWKYYINGKWETGSIERNLPNKKYPDSDDKSYYNETYSKYLWP